MIVRECIGIIGLGLVGRALAARLQAAGFDVIGHDHQAAPVVAWQQLGHRSVSSPDELMRHCRRVVLAVFDTTGVLQVLEGPDGVLNNMRPEAVVDCSTGDPEALIALSTRLAGQGVDFIEAPLSGSSQQIERGEATLLLGGSTVALARHDDLLTALASRRLRVGGAGMGARAKLATNLVLGLNRAALAEGMVFAERLGIEPGRFLELVLNSPARSDAALVKGSRMVDGDFAPQSRIRQHLKDLDLMLSQAGEQGQRLPLTTVHAELLRKAVSAGEGELDNAAIIQQLRRETR